VLPRAEIEAVPVTEIDAHLGSQKEPLLGKIFDSVVMLTSSNWFSEPRSNRYHYATRFARHLPVYFVQFDHGTGWSIEDTEVPNLKVVHLPMSLVTSHDAEPAGHDQRTEAARVLRSLGCADPLLWIYNPYCAPLARQIGGKIAVYHATENYLAFGADFLSGDNLESHQRILADGTRDLLTAVDLTIAVSDGVREQLVASGCATGRIVEVPNGCDAKFWLTSKAPEYVEPVSGRPVAFYQGGINRRLNFQLLRELAERMPDWDFWFCGVEDDNINEWTEIRSLKNVQYFGCVSPEQIADLARRASIGLVPFVDSYVLRTSFPLKVYEYIACGLPVVSTPIRALAGCPAELITFAESASTFAQAMRQLAPTRVESSALSARAAAARANDYGARFDAAVHHILIAAKERLPRKKNILVLYDDKFTHIGTIIEHILSFRNHSSNNIFYLPATVIWDGSASGSYRPGDEGCALPDDFDSLWNFDNFDAIVVHYSVRLSLIGYLPSSLRECVRRFSGEKILFIQDEYESVNNARRNIADLGITTIYTCIPRDGQEIIYPTAWFPTIEKIQTLTGYVPDSPEVERAALPIEQRETFIGYRGRRLPHHYGMLGYEKFVIGERVREEAAKRNIRVDIESDDSKRIYGSWYAFLGSCRATLGTESGSNIFDFDDSLRAKAQELRDVPFEEVYDEHFKPYDGPIRMNQISPKFFEAIRLRTALVCFPGTYSGILQPGRHYIVLEKDFSNIDEVFSKLADVSFLKCLTDRAYEDIIASGRYSYRAFIRSFDDWLDGRIPYGRAEIISAPIAVRRRQTIRPLRHDNWRDMILNDTVLGGAWQRTEFTQLFKARVDAPATQPAEEVSTCGVQHANRQEADGAAEAGRHETDVAAEIVAVGGDDLLAPAASLASDRPKRWYLQMIPLSWKRQVQVFAQRAYAKKTAGELSGAMTVIPSLWRLVPASIRARIARRLWL
jgi:glycosyltransferase involved in cell wall biosynthesis